MVRLWGGALRDADYMTVASFATHPRVLSNPVFCRSMCSFCFLFLSVVGHPLLFPGGVFISFGTALIGLNITFLIPWDLLKPRFRKTKRKIWKTMKTGLRDLTRETWLLQLSLFTDFDTLLVRDHN